MGADLNPVPPSGNSRGGQDLADRDISAVPVCEAHGRLVGIISEGDLMHPLACKTSFAVRGG
jgi:CBS domain-containing protein